MTPPKDATAGEALKMERPVNLDDVRAIIRDGDRRGAGAKHPTTILTRQLMEKMADEIERLRRPSADPAAVEAARRIDDWAQRGRGSGFSQNDAYIVARALLASTSLEAGEMERLRPDDGPPGSASAKPTDA